MGHRCRVFLYVMVIASLVLQVLAPGRVGPGATEAAILFQSPSLPSDQSPGPQTDPLLLFRSMLDLVVRQAVGVFGWQVVSLSSQLDHSTLHITGLQATGTGAWHVQALDEKAQPLTLDGSLTFTLEGQGYGSALNRVISTLKGTLQGTETELALESAVSGETGAGDPRQSATLSLRLTRKGGVSQAAVKSTGTTRSIAYGMTQTVVQSTFDREGQATHSTSVLTVRDLSRGESEVWLRAGAVGPATGSAETGMEQHYFQLVDGSRVSQYLDRFDLTTADNAYSLQKPAMLSSTLGGDLSYDLVLVDRGGEILRQTSGAGQEVRDSAVKGLRLPGGLGVQSKGGDKPWGQPYTPEEREHLINMITGLVGAGATGGLAYAAGVALGGGLGASLLIGLGAAAVIAAPVALFALGMATADRLLANADPFFIVPDGRPRSASSDQLPVRITRVTGGLVAPQTALSSEAVGVNAASPPVSQVTSGPAFDTYNDRPGAFVGGSIPAGAKAMGQWAWDAARPFGAMPSHTEPSSGGAQRHYFIHASTPLTVTADDNIIQYVYVDPHNPPAEILLQFYVGDGDGEHRAYWGEDRIQTDGVPGSSSLYPMGALPAAGGWVRLQIPAGKLGLDTQSITGILYSAYGGQIWWGPTTTSSRLTDSAPDALPVDQTPVLPATEPGAQLAFRTTRAMRLSADIVDANGAVVRNLMKDQDVQPGYQVLVWDAKDDDGRPVADSPYRTRLSEGAAVAAEAGITVSPLVARIRTPGSHSLVRGQDVPVIGEAYGAKFARFVVEYGESLQPKAWKMINSAAAPVLQPTSQESLRLFNPGNLANWNVGLDEYGPWKDSGLNGVYTLRLRAIGTDGREAVDTVPVIVGRLAHLAGGGTIVSPDGRAKVIVPPLAVRDPFRLMSVLPAAQLEAGGPWRESLPPGMRLAGEVYEILPPDETFRHAAMLELPYPAGSPEDKAGIWLGDGTPGGWRYLGGRADPRRGVIQAPVMGFSGARAWVAAFVGEPPGPDRPEPVPATPTFDVARTAPLVSSATAPAAFYTDLESGPGEWEALDVRGTDLALVRGSEAGLAAEDTALRVTRQEGGVRLVRVRATPYDADQFPILSFDYRVSPDYVPNLLVRSGGVWWQLLLSRAGAEGKFGRSEHFASLSASPLIADGAWHHHQLDLLGLLRAAQPEATRFQVDEIVLGRIEATGYLQYAPVDRDVIGGAYDIDNFAALSPTNATSFNFTFAPPSGVAFSGYNVAFDREKDTVPPENPQLAADQTMLSLPAVATREADGPWYVHVRGREAAGTWSATAHFPILVDRQPPEAGRPSPPPGGAGSPDLIQLPLRDATSGLDLTRLKLRMNDVEVTAGPGLLYDPETRAVELMPNFLKPLPSSLANGLQVNLSLLDIADYAGNMLAQPVSWGFTADRPRATALSLRRLTVAEGASAAVSPDGSQVAFVSTRSGIERVWVMRGDDYEEEAGSARPLTTSSAREFDPVWSPDGQWVAYVSEASGSQQVWVSAPDGSGARALTHIDGSLLSPTWSPDSKTLAFIGDGNLWTVSADGTSSRVLTRYIDQPLRAASWQPGGSLLAVAFKLYQETIQLYNLATDELTPLTHGGREAHPAWLNANTVLFTAPAAPGKPEAVWQINQDGSDEAILAGSGQSGSSDMEPAVADQGSAVALTSTRGGQRDIWLRAALQVARFDVSPVTGAAPGEPLQITYALPADSEVTLQVLNLPANIQRTLLDKTPQARGTQILTWEGTGSDGKSLAPGDYSLKLTVQTADGEDPIVRFAAARLLEKTDAGVLQFLVDQWVNQPVADTAGLRLQVFAEGQRARAVAEADGNPRPAFKLPAGNYDAVVTYGAVRREGNDLVVAAGTTTTRTVDLQLGALEVALQYASGQPAGGSAYVQVVGSDDPRRMPVAVKNDTHPIFVLPAGQYDVLAQVQGATETLHRVDVRVAQVTRREVNLGVGLLRVNVLAYGGQPADTKHIFIVQAFSPQDHGNPVAVDYNNPAQLHLPAGAYDVQIQYGVTPQNLNTSGTVVEWLKDVRLQSGQTVELEHKLRTARVELDMMEAVGKPADPQSLSFRVYRQGDRAAAVVTALFVNTATVFLTEGTYEVLADVSGTELARGDPVATFEVREGQDITRTVDLRLAHVEVTVYEAPGRLAEGSRLFATAYPTGKADSPFAIASSANPLRLTVLADTKYDLDIRLDGKQILRRGQSAEEGRTIAIQLGAADFK